MKIKIAAVVLGFLLMCQTCSKCSHDRKSEYQQMKQDSLISMYCDSMQKLVEKTITLKAEVEKLEVQNEALKKYNSALIEDKSQLRADKMNLEKDKKQLNKIIDKQ